QSRDSVQVRQDVGRTSASRHGDADEKLMEGSGQALDALHDRLVNRRCQLRVRMPTQRRLSHDPGTSRLVDAENFLSEQRLEELDDVERIARGDLEYATGKASAAFGFCHPAQLTNEAPHLVLSQRAKSHRRATSRGAQGT